MAVWHENLETVGADLFQRYRKRLMLPGIGMEIRRDYPGLPIVDVLVRVQAGRRIIQDGDDFRALQAIRSGRWQRVCRERQIGHRRVEVRNDRVSRILVTLGGVLFSAFCLLSLLALPSAGTGHWLVTGLVVAMVAALVWWRNRSGSASHGRPGETATAR